MRDYASITLAYFRSFPLLPLSPCAPHPSLELRSYLNEPLNVLTSTFVILTIIYFALNKLAG